MEKLDNVKLNNKRLFFSMLAFFFTTFLLIFSLDSFYKLRLAKNIKNPEPVVFDLYTTKETVGLRHLPMLSITPFSNVPQGTPLEVIGFQNRWVKVRSINTIGYVEKNFLEPRTMKKIKVINNTSMYSRPNSTQIIYTITEGSVLEIISKGEEWTNVRYKGSIGWVLTSTFFEIEK